MADRLPEFSGINYARACNNCEYGQLKKTGQKVMKSSYFIHTYQCICPLPIWLDRVEVADNELQVVVEADYGESTFVPTNRVKYVMTSTGYVMVDGACRTWRPRSKTKHKSALGGFLHRLRKVKT